jgi:hypothetical protein
MIPRPASALRLLNRDHLPFHVGELGRILLVATNNDRCSSGELIL